MTLFFLALTTTRAELKVSSDFESGSARVTKIDEETQTIRFRPAGQAARGWQNWWYLRVDGADTNRLVNLEMQTVTKISPAWSMPDRAAFSIDGRSWVHSAPGERRGNVKTYRIRTPSPTFWLAWGPPFTVSDATVFCRDIAAAHPFATTFELCKSREGRSVPGLRIAEGTRPVRERKGIWITARQHAWESGSSWVARGLVEWLVSPEEGARWIRQNAEVFIVPVMDADRVATGDGGKQSLPHDHNFDWSDRPVYAEVAAVQERVRLLLQQGRMDLFIDLHNPGAGKRNQEIYVIPATYVSPATAARQDRFVSLLRAQFPGLEIVDEKPPADPKEKERWHRLTAPWVQDRANPQTVAFTIETPWNTPQSTADGYRETGRKIGSALEGYLRGAQR